MKIFSLFSGRLVLLCLAPFPTHAKFSKMQTFEERCVGDSDDTVKTTIRVAHVGNSFQYYGDLPRLLERMLQESFDTVVQGSCLRPSSTLRSVLDKGNGMESRFTTPVALLPDGTYDLGYPTVQAMLNVTDSSIKEGESYWDYVIVNDRSLHPADLETRGQSLQKLKEDYVPLLESVGMPTVVFSMTWAYREPTRGSETFGTFDDLTELLLEGYEEYEDVVDDSIVAPTGLAFQYVRDKYHNEMGDLTDADFSWRWLYNSDDFHPSPHGQLLQAFVLYSTMLDVAPPSTYSTAWWDTIRYYQPDDRDSLPLPTIEEAAILRDAACHVVSNYNR